MFIWHLETQILSYESRIHYQIQELVSSLILIQISDIHMHIIPGLIRRMQLSKAYLFRRVYRLFLVQNRDIYSSLAHFNS